MRDRNAVEPGESDLAINANPNFRETISSSPKIVKEKAVQGGE